MFSISTFARCTFLRKIHRKLSKYDYDNYQKLQAVAFLKNGVLQLLTSWQNQAVLQCLKHHEIYMFSDFTRVKVLYI